MEPPGRGTPLGVCDIPSGGQSSCGGAGGVGPSPPLPPCPRPGLARVLSQGTRLYFGNPFCLSFLSLFCLSRVGSEPGGSEVAPGGATLKPFELKVQKNQSRKGEKTRKSTLLSLTPNTPSNPLAPSAPFRGELETQESLFSLPRSGLKKKAFGLFP